MNYDFDPQKILDTYWDGNIPINYENIASQMGISVEEIEMDGESFGFLETNNQKYSIYIKKGFAHKNKVIAFLFAKILVGIPDGGISVKKIDFNTNQASFHSSIAQGYLHQFLIPERTLLFCIQKDKSSLAILAKQFDVSESLMQKALQSYKII